MFNWSDEAIERLRTLATEGLTSAQIASDMGISRNAVIGKCLRAGFQLHHKQCGHPHINKRRAEPRLKLKMKFKPMEFAASASAQEPLNIPLLELQNHHCREITGHDGTFATYCGHEKYGISSYCRDHHEANEYPAPRKVSAAAYIRPAVRAA